MKLCVIGNSHAAAIRLGWDELSSQYPDLTVDFYAAALRGMATLYRKSDTLLSDDPAVTKAMVFSSRGKKTIAIRDYDAFAFIFGSGVKALMTVFRHHRTIAMQGRTKARYLISDAAASAVAAEALAQSQAISIARMIREVSDAGIFVLSTPTPTADVIDGKYSIWNDAASLRPRMLDLLNQSIAEVQTDIPFTFVHQPEETIRNGFTDPTYSKGSTRLSHVPRTHDDNEPHHMNTRYGAIMMRELIKSLPLDGKA